MTEGDRVASRWVAEGHNRGRPIRLWGIVISRIEDGEIVEDWAASDSLDLVRQLGPWRMLLLGIACRASVADRRASCELRLLFAGPPRRHVDQHPQT